MKKLLIITGIVIFSILLLFMLFELTGLMPLGEVGQFLESHGKKAALIIMFLLAMDLVLPVPSSILMTMNGALLGPVLGTLASFVGSTIGAWLGFWLARRFGRGLIKRFMSDAELDQMDAFVERFGPVGIVISRPIPMMMETTSCVAGLSSMPLWVFLLASSIGTLPTCALYAWAGASSRQLGSGVPIFLALVILPGLAWGLFKWIGSRLAFGSSSPPIT